MVTKVISRRKKAAEYNKAKKEDRMDQYWALYQLEQPEYTSSKRHVYNPHVFTHRHTCLCTCLCTCSDHRYEQFDDFLEMVIEFGYITLFASAFPLAGVLSLCCNLVEIKSDLFKLARIYQALACLHACQYACLYTCRCACLVQDMSCTFHRD